MATLTQCSSPMANSLHNFKCGKIPKSNFLFSKFQNLLGGVMKYPDISGASFFVICWIRRDLFYLLDYSTRRSEKLRFEKKNWFRDKLAGNFQIHAYFCSPEKMLCRWFVKFFISVIIKCYFIKKWSPANIT